MAMKLYTLDEMMDRDIGPVGTPERDRFDAEVAGEIHAYHIGEAIRQARLARNLTQEQLGERMGVQKAQISRLERGKSPSFSSMMLAFKALGVQVSLDMKGIGRIVL